MNRLSAVLETVGSARALWHDLEAICALGGRFAGTDSEARAKVFLGEQLRTIGAPVVEHPVDYPGWSRGESALEVAGRRFTCEALVRSPATPAGGLAAELLDIGRGTAEDFKRFAAEIAGRIVMVRHEYMFATETVHRRRKYQWAMDHGAVGFIIASHLPGDLTVTGSSGALPGRGIPAVGISAETAAALATHDRAHTTVRLHVEAQEFPARTENLSLDIPGRGDGWVVLCAHLDGHHLAQSAMDNATGLASVLAVARALAPHCEHLRRGLRVMFFSVEEWALAGSRCYVEGLSDEERDRIACVLNLDSIAGSSRLTALTSDYPALAPRLQETANEAGVPLGIHAPIMANSDHYNFAVNGIPATRIVAGFDEPGSNLRYVLSPGDTLHRVTLEEMQTATCLAATLALRFCEAEQLELREQWQRT